MEILVTDKAETSETLCRLCKKLCTPQHSHILPAFVFRWLKDSSGNGHIRSSKEPNLRSQDGEKRYWLCTNCEQLFSVSEGTFANSIFHPYLKRSGDRFPYERWLLHFSTSVSWRVLKLALEEGNVASWSPEALVRAESAELVWREYLLGKIPHPKDYRQHILPMDEISGFGGDTPTNINRYLMRAVEFDLPHGLNLAYTFAKLGRFIIIGHISDSNPTLWKDSRINANHGVIEPRKHALPLQLWDYLKSRSVRADAALGSISQRQQEKIETSFRANVDQYASSDAFRAMQADVNAFGDGAFKMPPK